MKSLDIQDSFGHYLRHLRRAARLTQAEFGAAVGYSPGQISMLENNQRTPDPTVVAALFVAALGLKPAEPDATHLLSLARKSYTGSINTPAPIPTHTTRITRIVERRVIWERQVLGLLEDIPPLPTQLAPRANEQLRLVQLLGAHQRTVLVGLPGIGKTTLAAQFARQHAQSHSVLWMTVSPGINQTLDDVLRQLALFVIAYGHDATFVSAITGSSATATATASASFSPAALLPVGQLLEGICANLNEMAEPLVVLDDAHHLRQDAAVMSALSRIHNLAQQCRMLFTSREMLPLGEVPHELVRGLAPEQARAWLKQLHGHNQSHNHGGDDGMGDVPTQEIQALIQKTEGNPLLLRLAAEFGRPAEPRAIITSTLTHLSPNAQQVLKFLSIVSREVNLIDPALAQLLQTEFDSYVHAQAVHELQRYVLIDQPTQATLHELIREHVRESLQLQPHKLVHYHRVAALWANQQGDMVAAARHWHQANDLKRACDAITHDTHRLVLTNRAMEAVSVIDAMLSASGNTHTYVSGTSSTHKQHAAMLCRLRVVRGELLVDTTRADEARADFFEALALADAAEHKPLEKARIAQRLAHYLQSTGAFADALSLCDQAEHLLGRSKSPQAMQLRLELNGPRIKALIGLARFAEAQKACLDLQTTANKLALLIPKTAESIRAETHLALGYMARIDWRSDDAIRHLTLAARYAQRANLTAVQANSLILHSATERDLGRFGQAEALAEQSLAAAQSSGNQVMVATVLHWMSVLSYFRDEHEEALQHSERAAEIRRKLGDREGILACELLQGVALLALNRWDRLQVLTEAVLSIIPAMQNPWLRGYAEYICGVVSLCDWSRSQHLSEARGHFERALAIESFRNDPDLAASAQLFLALAHAVGGHLALCDQALQKVVLPIGHAQPQLLSALTKAIVQLACGNAEQAQAEAEQLVAHARETGYFVYVTEAKRVIEICSSASANTDTSTRTLLRRVICGSE